jgi:hypothetical protein
MTGDLWAEAKVSGGVGGKWTAYAERRAFKAFLDTATDPDLELFYKDQLILKSGQRLEIATHTPITGYESWSPKTTFDLSDRQNLALKTAVRFLPNIAGSEHVEAVYCGKGYGMIATDTLVMMASLDPSYKQEFFLPAAVANVLSFNKGKIGLEKNGVGAVVGNGFVYQPLSAELDRYPKDNCKKSLDTAKGAPVLFEVQASPLLETLRVASQFLVDKNEGATVEAGKAGLQITVDMISGKFQRSVPVSGTCKLDAPVQWSVKRILPWLEYAVDVKKDVELLVSRITNATAFQFTEAKQTDILLFADL